MLRPKRFLALATAATAASAALLTGCSSSGTGPVADPVFTGSSASAASTVAPAAPSSSAVAPSVAPAGSTAIPGVPAVAAATDLTTKPVPSAGTGTEPTVLVTRDLLVGTGASVSSTATVKLKYVGALFNGTVFDTSWGQSGASGADQASFALSGVIPGFAQGLIGMKVGGRREIVIPSALGYGAQASGKIPANSTLVFVVDMTGTSG